MVTNQLKESVKRMRRAQVSREYDIQCMAKGSQSVGSERVATLQLRFISDNEYVVEAICSQFIFSPIEVERGELPMMVTKESGQSGIVWGEEPSGVIISLMGRKSGVFVRDGVISTDINNMVGVEMADGPITSCQGYGFACCQSDFQEGLGDQLLGVTDCPKTCYSSCRERPVVLSFASSPFVDPTTRQLTVKRGQNVTFSYVISDDQTDPFAGLNLEEENQIAVKMLTIVENFLNPKTQNDQSEDNQVWIDFGDGQRSKFSDLQGSVERAYTCNKAQCVYTASIRAINGQGVESADTIINSIKVVVQ